MDKIKSLHYNKKDLVSIFEEYNTCAQSQFTSFTSKDDRDFFNLTLRPRLNNTSFSLNNTSTDTQNVDFDKKSGFGFGIEMEYIFPFNKNKWSIAIEPTYQGFKSEKTIDVNNVSGGTLTTKVDYGSVEVPDGIRHYLFLNENSKIFIDAAYVFTSRHVPHSISKDKTRPLLSPLILIRILRVESYSRNMFFSNLITEISPLFLVIPYFKIIYIYHYNQNCFQETIKY